MRVRGRSQALLFPIFKTRYLRRKMENPGEENPLWWLFKAEDKADFLDRAKDVTLSQAMLDRTALFATSRLTPLRHLVGTREKHPVVMTDSDWDKLCVTRKAGKLLSVLRDQNRAVFHAFWFDLPNEEVQPWWLIWFDLRDRETHNNHWKATNSPHAHMISYLTHPRDQIGKYVEALAKDPNYNLPHSGGAHVRFEDDGWQDFRWGPHHR